MYGDLQLMRNEDTADVVARVRARLGRLTGLVRGGAARPDPAEAAAYAEAVRAVFLAGMTDDIPGPPGPLPPADPPAPSPAAAHERSTASATTVPAVTATSAPAPRPEATTRPAKRRRSQPGETAPEFLLRTPTSVAPVADDFFEDLARRVEADR